MLTTLYFKMTDPDGTVWYASSVLVKSSPEAQLKTVRTNAVRKGIKTTYDLATKEDYWAYRNGLKASLARGAT